MRLQIKKLLLLVFALPFAKGASAAVTYVNPEPDIAIPSTFGGIYLDLLTSGVNSSTVSGAPDASGDSYTISFSEPPSGNWHINLFFGGAGIAHNTTLQPYRADSGNNLSAVDNLLPSTLLDGNPVSPEPSTGAAAPLTVASFGGSGSGLGGGSGVSNSDNHMGIGADQFDSGSFGYIGFVLDPGTASEQFGWMRVTLNNNGTPGIIHDWAYSPEPITVGAVPEPSAFGLLALSSIALLRRRRR